MIFLRFAICFTNYSYTVDKRFMRYAQIDTQSDPMSNTFPTTEKQKDLSRLLVKGNYRKWVLPMQYWTNMVMYTPLFRPTHGQKVPVICFYFTCGYFFRQQRHRCEANCAYQYNGGDIVLPDDETVVISAKEHPYLASKKGDDIITASGTTLLEQTIRPVWPKLWMPPTS